MHSKRDGHVRHTAILSACRGWSVATFPSVPGVSQSWPSIRAADELLKGHLPSTTWSSTWCNTTGSLCPAPKDLAASEFVLCCHIQNMLHQTLSLAHTRQHVLGIRHKCIPADVCLFQSGCLGELEEGVAVSRKPRQLPTAQRKASARLPSRTGFIGRVSRGREASRTAAFRRFRCGRRLRSDRRITTAWPTRCVISRSPGMRQVGGSR